MARGFDELIDFLLSEIALCGDQGELYSLAVRRQCVKDSDALRNMGIYLLEHLACVIVRRRSCAVPMKSIGCWAISISNSVLRVQIFWRTYTDSILIRSQNR